MTVSAQVPHFIGHLSAVHHRRGPLERGVIDVRSPRHYITLVCLVPIFSRSIHIGLRVRLGCILAFCVAGAQPTMTLSWFLQKVADDKQLYCRRMRWWWGHYCPIVKFGFDVFNCPFCFFYSLIVQLWNGVLNSVHVTFPFSWRIPWFFSYSVRDDGMAEDFSVK